METGLGRMFARQTIETNEVVRDLQEGKKGAMHFGEERGHDPFNGVINGYFMVDFEPGVGVLRSLNPDYQGVVIKMVDVCEIEKKSERDRTGW